MALVFFWSDPEMGLNSLNFGRCAKRLLVLSSLVGVSGLFSPSEVCAQSVSAKIIQPASYGAGADQTNFPAATSSNGYQTPAYLPSAGTQLSLQKNRPGLIANGRMVSTAIRRQENLAEPNVDDSTSVQDTQDPFGENQKTPQQLPNQFRPVVPQNATGQGSVNQETGKLPPEVFKDPFTGEIRPNANPPRKPTASTQPQNPSDNVRPPAAEQGPTTDVQQNFSRQKSKLDSDIDYQSRRGYDTLPSRSNVYQPPEARPVQPYSNESYQGEIYFVPAYEPIPGLQAPRTAPPATIYQEHYQAAPHGYHQAVPAMPHAHGNEWSIGSEQSQPTVYSDVVVPHSNSYSQGPVTSVRRGLLEKIKSDLHHNWGVGDFKPCDCPSENLSFAPAFYFGFQGAGVASTDVGNGQGSEVDADGGSAFMFALGRLNGNNLRTEAELSFRNNDISSFTTVGGNFNHTGQLQAFSGMANAYWEFTSFPSHRIKPYVGAGVGFTSLTTTLQDAAGNSLLSSGNNSDSSFAYQWMAGLNVKVNDNLDLFGEYRFLDMDGFQIRSTSAALSGDYGYSASTVGLGLRWKF